MSEFAKLYETELGQILIIFDSNDDYKPSITAWFTPKGLGVCKLGVNGFPDTDKGWEDAESLFNGIDQNKAFNIVSAAIKAIGLNDNIQK